MSDRFKHLASVIEYIRIDFDKDDVKELERHSKILHRYIKRNPEVNFQDAPYDLVSFIDKVFEYFQNKIAKYTASPEIFYSFGISLKSLTGMFVDTSFNKNHDVIKHLINKLEYVLQFYPPTIDSYNIFQSLDEIKKFYKFVDSFIYIHSSISGVSKEYFEKLNPDLNQSVELFFRNPINFFKPNEKENVFRFDGVIKFLEQLFHAAQNSNIGMQNFWKSSDSIVAYYLVKDLFQNNFILNNNRIYKIPRKNFFLVYYYMLNIPDLIKDVQIKDCFGLLEIIKKSAEENNEYLFSVASLQKNHIYDVIATLINTDYISSEYQKFFYSKAIKMFNDINNNNDVRMNALKVINSRCEPLFLNETLDFDALISFFKKTKNKYSNLVLPIVSVLLHKSEKFRSESFYSEVFDLFATKDVFCYLHNMVNYASVHGDMEKNSEFIDILIDNMDVYESSDNINEDEQCKVAFLNLSKCLSDYLNRS